MSPHFRCWQCTRNRIAYSSPTCELIVGMLISNGTSIQLRMISVESRTLAVDRSREGDCDEGTWEKIWKNSIFFLSSPTYQSPTILQCLPPLADTTWSRNGNPMAFAAVKSAAVISRSSVLGLGSPLG